MDGRCSRFSDLRVVSVGESSPPRRANDVASTLLEGHLQSSSLFMSLMEASHRLCSRVGESTRHVTMVLAFDLGFRSFRTNPALDRFGFCWLCMPGSWIGNTDCGAITYRKARQPSTKGEHERAGIMGVDVTPDILIAWCCVLYQPFFLLILTSWSMLDCYSASNNIV